MKKNRRLTPVRPPDSPPVMGPSQEELPGESPLAISANDQGLSSPPPLPLLMVVGGALIAIFWAFWPTLTQLARTWNREPDYSHGWFVVPIALYLLWSMRSSMPKLQLRFHPGGLLLLGIVIAIRILARWAYFDFVDGWMLPLTVLGLAWTLVGWKWARWSIPAIAFLFFMVPLPFRIENELSRPLQWIATKVSCFSLQLFGLPAIPEGTTILLGQDRLEVERACSGLRIFMGVCALSYVYAFLVKRVWWERLVMVLSAIPIALIANAARIVVTGLFYYGYQDVSMRRIAHDWIGYGMIGFAACLFGLVLFYMRWLVPDVELLESKSLNRVV